MMTGQRVVSASVAGQPSISDVDPPRNFKTLLQIAWDDEEEPERLP